MLTRIVAKRGLSRATQRPKLSRRFTSATNSEPAQNAGQIVEDGSLESVSYDIIKGTPPISYRTPTAWHIRILRFSKLATTNDVIRFVERVGQAKPTKVIRLFNLLRTSVFGWRVEFASREEAETAAKNLMGKPFGLFRQPYRIEASDQGALIEGEADENMVEILNVPAGSRRIDVSSFLSVGSFVHPRHVYERPGESKGTKRWLARFNSAEERTIAMIKRSGQHMHPFGRTDVVSEEKIRLVPMGISNAMKKIEN